MSNLYDHEGNRKYLTVAERTAFLQAAENMSQEVYAIPLQELTWLRKFHGAHWAMAASMSR